MELIKQTQDPHVVIATPKFRGHNGGAMLTHDSIFKIAQRVRGDFFSSCFSVAGKI